MCSIPFPYLLLKGSLSICSINFSKIEIYFVINILIYYIQSSYLKTETTSGCYYINFKMLIIYISIHFFHDEDLFCFVSQRWFIKMPKMELATIEKLISSGLKDVRISLFLLRKESKFMDSLVIIVEDK